MRVMSLFDGGSTGLICLRKAGIKVDSYSAAEIDKYALQVSEFNHLGVQRLGDVNKFKEWDPSLFEVDLLIGGSPCQSFSRQGKGLNFEDPRGKLFFIYNDILNHIRDNYNPDVKFMLENVDMKKEYENVITEYLGVEPIHINSDLLIPQNRPRTYWTDIDLKEIKPRSHSLLDVLEDVELKDYETKGHIKICKSFSEESRNLISVVNGEVRVKQPVKIGYAVASVGDGINISFPTSKSRRGRVVKGRSSCLDTQCNFGVLDSKNQVRPFTLKELERLQGLPEDYTQCVEPNQRKKIIGNGWTVDVITEIFKNLK